MGNTSSSAVHSCLVNAVGGDSALVAVSNNNPLYQLTDVKPYNLDIPVAPAAVTYPRTPDEVAAIVRCAADAKVKVQPRSGGHSYGNYGIGGTDGALVVDLQNIHHFSMDNSTWTATIGAGTLLADVTQQLHDAGGRAMAHGTCPQVGIGGHATIGGLGPTSRMWGSALDHVEEVTVVLANASVVTASTAENPDLFFALKGAGASFGIITEFKVRTEPEPGEAVQYSYSFAFGSHAAMATTFTDWQAFVADPALSRKFASQVIVLQLGMIVSGTFFGSRAEFDALNLTGRLRPHDPSAQYVVDFTDWLGLVGHWAEDVVLQLVGGIPSAFYSKSLALRRSDLLPSSTIDRLFRYFDTAARSTDLWFAIFDLEGGATNDVATDATAYAHRDALYYLQTYSVDMGRVTAKSRDFLDGINGIITSSMPDTQFGAYAGYVDPALKDGPLAYWGSNLPRLERIKRVVDPDDVFHNPQSVKPATP